MNETTGGALLLNIVIIIVALLIVVFTTSFAYTKAFRAKTLIVGIIEENEGYNGDNNDYINSQIKENLSDLGYHTEDHKCKNRHGGTKIYPSTDNSPDGYCIYEIKTTDDDGNEIKYYEIETYMHYDIPLFKLSFPVYGQTRSYYIKHLNNLGEEE